MTARRIRYLIAVAALAGIWLAMLRLGRGSLDRSIYQALYSGSNPLLAGIARMFTALGEPTLLVAAGVALALVLWWSGRGRFAGGILLVVLLGRALTQAQKYWIGRARPDLEPHMVVVKTWSFPSGHAAGSMIFFLALALALTPRLKWRRLAAAGAILLSILIGISRVMLGVHWPSDVIGGWSFGLLWVLLTFPTAERLFSGDPRASARR